MPDTRLSEREWTSVVAGLALLAGALAVIGAPGYPLAGRVFGTKVLPVALVATAVYARTDPDAAWWTLGALVAWGFVSMVVAGFVGFLALGSGGTGTTSPTPTEYAVSSLKFALVDAAALSAVYWAAARVRSIDRRASLGVLAVAPILMAILAVALLAVVG